MGGGLMQLVAYGAQDIYLTGDPQITFFSLLSADLFDYCLISNNRFAPAIP